MGIQYHTIQIGGTQFVINHIVPPVQQQCLIRQNKKTMDNKTQMSACDFIKYLADNHIEITIPEDKRKYPGQQCQDETINADFRALHHDIVNTIIQFCVKHNIVIDDFNLHADGLDGSIREGSWQSCTDSCLCFRKFSEGYKDVVSMNKIVSNEEFNKIVAKEEPFLISL